MRLTVDQMAPMVPDQLLPLHRAYLLTSARLTAGVDQSRTRRSLYNSPLPVAGHRASDRHVAHINDEPVAISRIDREG